MIIIGLTGRNAGGKTTAGEVLATKGFTYVSLSDVIREEAKQRGLSAVRENLIALGNELRERHGPSALATLTVAKMQSDRNYVVDSIRHPAEVEALKKAGPFTLFHIFAPLEARFARSVARARDGDALTLQDFIRQEEREFASSNAAAQQLLETERLANRTIENSGTVEAFGEQMATALRELEVSFARPSWDQYFMDIAVKVAARSNCMKRQVAAVVVSDKRIISTGYNGTPRGVKNCNEGGCPRCNGFSDSGRNLEECLCSHGEENAIVQASYHGIAIKDATLYTTYSPCLMCSKMIINAGIRRVVYNEAYPLNDTATGMLREAGVDLVRLVV
ncbi:MAG: AAA family ATPase [Gemmatimonadaceae bacterium]|nr:AAA family ATPase [Gemmatimonadaceae bacterium]